MAVVITAIILCIINLSLWIVLAVKFRKIFSTDEIIQNTREELDRMISDINRNADRNITLIEEKIKELKAVSAEADRRLSIIHNEMEKKAKSFDFETKIVQQTARGNSSRTGTAAAAEKYRREQAQGDLFSNDSVSGDYPERIPVQSSVYQQKKNDQYVKGQYENNIFQNETIAPVKEIPIVTPELYLSDNPVEPKKDFNTLVKEKNRQGKTVDEIAAELGRSTQEVKFALEFS